MNKYHQEILEEIKKVSSRNPKDRGRFDPGRYMGTSKPCLNITNPQTREIIKQWIKEHKEISLDELLDFLDSTFAGQSHTERSLGGKILEYLPKQRMQIPSRYIDKWLTGAEGWGEVDSLCQSAFNAKDMLGNWEEWEKLLKKLAEDKDIHKRRASLVLLAGPVRQSEDKRFADLAFENISTCSRYIKKNYNSRSQKLAFLYGKNVDKLKAEKDILITKAISWLLRDLIKYHKSRVEGYLKKNQEVLPKIAIREVTNKLQTGRK